MGWFCKKLKPRIGGLATDLAASMRNEPDAWKLDEYHAIHRSGVQVWIANEDYGLGVAKGYAQPNAGHLPKADRQVIWEASLELRRSAIRKALAQAHAALVTEPEPPPRRGPAPVIKANVSRSADTSERSSEPREAS